jgi:hypothetical protein
MVLVVAFFRYTAIAIPVATLVMAGLLVLRRITQ